jgi:hypothetical protein
MNYIYNEKIYLPYVFLLISIFVIGIVVYSWFDTGFDKETIIVSGIAIVAVLFSTINFSRLDISATENVLQFRFGLFKKQVYIKNITNLEKEKLSFMKFGGYGIRFGRGKILGYVARGGEGIQFVDTKDNKKYFVSSEKSDELISLLVNYGAKRIY